MHQLTEGHKNRIRNLLIQGARNYKKYLTDKVFKIVCADGSYFEVRFFESDFKHLTGVGSDLGNEDFYKNCVKGIISTGNIKSNQKYDWGTLKKKSKKIENIHQLLYKDGQKTILLDTLKTNTYIFPIAIKNEANDICIGFVSDIHRARSLRSANNSMEAKREIPIIAIFARKNNSKIFGELIYISGVSLLYEKMENILIDMDEKLENRFLEVITTSTAGRLPVSKDVT